MNPTRLVDGMRKLGFLGLALSVSMWKRKVNSLVRNRDLRN